MGRCDVRVTKTMRGEKRCADHSVVLGRGNMNIRLGRRPQEKLAKNRCQGRTRTMIDTRTGIYDLMRESHKCSMGNMTLKKSFNKTTPRLLKSSLQLHQEKGASKSQWDEDLSAHQQIGWNTKKLRLLKLQFPLKYTLNNLGATIPGISLHCSVLSGQFTSPK